MTDCPDAEKAALAEELEQWLGAPSEIHDGVIWKDSSGLVVSTDMLLADLSPAAKAILEKAQAHDRLREELISCQVFLAAPATKAERTAKKRSIDAALAGKEPE